MSLVPGKVRQTMFFIMLEIEKQRDFLANQNERMKEALKEIAEDADDPGIRHIASNALEE